MQTAMQEGIKENYRLKPYMGNPSVRNFRGGGGNVGIIEARLAPLPYSTNTSTTRLQQLKREIIEYLNEESADIDDPKPWLGCSDIIEAIFGKYKNFSAKTPMKEIGRAVLTMPVFTSEITLEEVKMAMENERRDIFTDFVRVRKF